jgi:membrane protein
VALERDEPKSFVTKRAKALALTFGAIVFLGIVVFLIAALPPLVSDAGDVGRISLQILRWPILAVVMLFGLGLLYRFSTKEHTSGGLGVVTAGSVIATIGWLLVSALFAVYTANFASYSKTYGALASIVVLLLWLWLSSLLILVGAEFDGTQAA